MKKLILLFSAILISGFCSAQSADGTYESGYQSGYKSIAKVYPTITPANPQWQTLDVGNLSAPNTSSDKKEFQQNLKINYNKGYAQGILDAKHAMQTSNEASKPKSTKS